MDFTKIKLVIWDLDQTFWNGTLNEEAVSIAEENVFLLKALNERGIVNSICSKNDFDKVQKFLEANNLWDEFVFPYIAWSSKGEAIKNIISDMNLRSANVLFIDDNPSNLKEASFFCPDIMTADPGILPDLIKYVNSIPASDKERKRLHQYKVLEKKREAKSLSDSNEEFLLSSNIKVLVHTDCIENIDRLHELLMRTNQLNYTKNRMPKDKLRSLFLSNDVNSGYVTATDNFGDYGIVGVFACKDNSLIHFAFSCRTMSMGIEQYIYNYLNCPELNVVGEVSYIPQKNLPTPWINANSHTENSKQSPEIKNANANVLIKGPCDLEVVTSLLSISNLDKEFTFVAPNGVSIESYNTTTHMVGALEYPDKIKEEIINELPFSSEFFSATNFKAKNMTVYFTACSATLI